MSFREIHLNLPAHLGCEVVGFLYESDDVAELGQDMIEVRVPTGVTINAGWYPEGSPEGAYRVRTWGRVEFPDMQADNADDAHQLILTLIGMLTSKEPQPISDSFTTMHPDRCYAFA